MKTLLFRCATQGPHTQARLPSGGTSTPRNRDREAQTATPSFLVYNGIPPRNLLSGIAASAYGCRDIGAEHDPCTRHTRVKPVGSPRVPTTPDTEGGSEGVLTWT